MEKLLTIRVDDVYLAELLPPYFRSVKDFIALMSTEQIELERFQKYILRVWNNLYVQTCDITTLRYHENLLGIFIQPDDTLEVRRARILNRYNTMLPITSVSLRLRLDTLLGTGNWELSTDYPNYTVSVTFLNVAESLVYEAINMMIQMLPAHLSLIFVITDTVPETRTSLPISGTTHTEFTLTHLTEFTGGTIA
ncbi:MAG: YmfQ family protein [Oscillospiraceae bacterium]|nr:YmfQ family protein [Oscillospiraceae bacterium]